MESLRHIGFGKAFRFFWTTLYAGLLHICIVPQIRVLLLRIAGATIGRDTIIMNIDFTNAYHYGFRTFIVGNRVFIGDGVMIDLRGGVTIKDDVTISNRTCIVSHINVGYTHHPLQKKYPLKESRVAIKSGSYIGTGAILLPGVTVGRESVVAAGAVVIRDVLTKTVVAGVPAKVVGSSK
jgi:acetyltransferase-like isoleucine patch superfamily enzyme